jgi:dTDP-4-amino-4,6-dideoxygalactose transaminase
VIAVHLFGNVAPVKEIEALGVPVLEDASQAAGSLGPDGRPGAVGTAGTYSFYPSKNLGAFGDAGAITTSDPALAERARLLRSHGSRDKETFEQIGYNSRLDALQAAILRVLLPHLDEWSEGRRRVAARYEQAGLGAFVRLPSPVNGSAPAWHLYVTRTPEPDLLAESLRERKIEARPYYRIPAHEQPAMREFAPRHSLPGTEAVAWTNLAIPISPVLDERAVEDIVLAVREHDAAVIPPLRLTRP